MKFKKSLISAKFQGQAALEYVIIFAVIALLVGGFISKAGAVLNSHFNTMANQILR